jgi:hypothetical protein
MDASHPRNFFTQVVDPVTNTSSGCGVYEAHGHYPKTWTQCSVPTFEFKVDSFDMNNRAWSLEFRRQYQGYVFCSQALENT